MGACFTTVKGYYFVTVKKNKIWSIFNSILPSQKVLGLLVSCIVIFDVLNVFIVEVI